MTDKKKPNQNEKTIFKGTKSHPGPEGTLGEKGIPQVKRKSFEEITVQSVIKLPRNQVRPVNQRIFCFEVDPGEIKTEGGLYLPTSYNKPEAKGGQTRKLMRYFVIDVADDCTIRFSKDRNSEARKIERGDEVYPFIPDTAVEHDVIVLHDFYNQQDYVVFHETELGGVGVSPLISKEE